MLKTEDIKFLDSLASRLSKALYDASLYRHGKKEEPYVTHDDYDRLREITQREKLEQWEREHGK